MAHLLYIVYSGGTINLNSGNVRMLEQYVPRMGDGEKVVDGVELEFSGTAVTEIQTEMQKVHNALREAQAYQVDKTGSPVYAYFQPNGYTEAWRTELKPYRTNDWKLTLDSDSMGKARWEDAYKVKGLLTWTRGDYWEGVEAQIPLTNANGTANTAGLTIKNCGDGTGASPTKRDNTVSISSASVSGDLPGATRLEITNTYNNAARNYTWWIGHNVNSDPANFVHVIEAEDSTVSGGAGGTVVANANYSGGEARTEVVYNSNFVSGYSATYKWALSTAILNAVRGNYVRAMARFTGTLSETTIWVKLQIILGATVIWDGPQVLLSTLEIQELGSFRLPPYLLKSGDLYPLDLQMIVVDTAGTADKTITLDSVELMPLDGWRKLGDAGYGQGYNVRIVDDGINDLIYTDSWSTAGKVGNYIGYGEAIKLHPGKDQKLYFMWTYNGADALNDKTASVKLYYRPRRRTI